MKTTIFKSDTQLRQDVIDEVERDWRLRVYSNLEIAERLFVSPKTVDTYRSRIMAKLDLHRRSELVEYALGHGLLE